MKRTIRECKTILFNLGVKFGISPSSILRRFLSDKDKQYLREGLIEIVELESAMEVWRGNGMPYCGEGEEKTTKPVKPSFSEVRLYPPFIPWSDETKEQVDAAQKHGSIREPGAQGISAVAQLPPYSEKLFSKAKQRRQKN